MSSTLPAGPVVLLVDDEPLVRMGTALLIEELDYVVLQASSAKQALEMLADNKNVEILVTDFRMPDLDGLEMISQAKEIAPEIKAVLMTGYAVDDERFAVVDTPRLAKPFGIDELQRALKSSC